MSFNDISAAAQSILPSKLAHAIQLDLRRAGESTSGLGLSRGAAASVAEDRLRKSGVNDGSDMFKSNVKDSGVRKSSKFNEESEEADTERPLKRKEVQGLDDSDGDDAADEEEDNDDAQGTLRFGAKKELANYEDADDADMEKLVRISLMSTKFARTTFGMVFFPYPKL